MFPRKQTYGIGYAEYDVGFDYDDYSYGDKGLLRCPRLT